MIVETVVTGAIEENCYILKKNNTCLVIDPGDDYPKIKEKIGDDKVVGVLVTHSHFDHVGALRNFLNKRSIKVFKKSNLQEKEYELGDFKFEVIYTPGHSADSVTFYFKEDKTMFVGDFVFQGSIGRCDLPTGDENVMKQSLEKIKQYDDDIILYPGHGDKTTLKVEKETNIYFK